MGRVDDSFTSGRAFRRDPGGTITWLDVPGAGFKAVSGINNRGQIVGCYTDPAGVTPNPDGTQPPGTVHGYLWDDGHVTRFDVPGSLLTCPSGINDRGHIAGAYRDRDGRAHAFLLRNGRYTTIDAPGRTDFTTYGFNNRGDIVIPEPGVGEAPAATDQPTPQVRADTPRPQPTS